VAEWLRSGLQSRLHRFDSGRRLYKSPIFTGVLLLPYKPTDGKGPERVPRRVRYAVPCGMDSRVVRPVFAMPWWLALVLLPFYAVWVLFLLTVAAACVLAIAAIGALVAVLWVLWFAVQAIIALHRRYARTSAQGPT
jgi:hypothetical protein